MKDSSKIRVLNEFSLPLRLLNAYNDEHFRHTAWQRNLRSVGIVLLTTLLCVSQSTLITLSIWYLIESDVDLSKFASVSALLISLLQTNLVIIALIMNNRIIREIIDRLQKAVDQRVFESKESFNIYDRVERTHALISAILVKMSIVTWIIFDLLPGLFPIFYKIFGYPPPQLWTLNVEIHSLLGHDIYTGFYCNYVIVLFSALATIVIIMIFASIYIGVFLYIDGMVRDLKMRLMAIAGDSTTRHRRSLNQEGNWSNYVHSIKFHNEIISVAQLLCNMMGLILFGWTLTCTIALAFNLFVFEMIETPTPEICVAMADISIVCALTFAQFYLSEWITQSLLQIGDVFYDSPWYRLPAKRQKLMVLPLQRAQRELRLMGLGLFDCSLPVFATIIRTASSYFLILREFK